MTQREIKKTLVDTGTDSTKAVVWHFQEGGRFSFYCYEVKYEIAKDNFIHLFYTVAEFVLC